MLILLAILHVIQNKSILNQACVTEHKTDKRIMSRGDGCHSHPRL